MSTTQTPYDSDERQAYDEGREAQRNGLSFFDSPYMVPEGRRLKLICAFSTGFTDESDGVTVEERFSVSDPARLT
jgi:hypothetical protein